MIKEVKKDKTEQSGLEEYKEFEQDLLANLDKAKDRFNKVYVQFMEGAVLIGEVNREVLTMATILNELAVCQIFKENYK